MNTAITSVGHRSRSSITVRANYKDQTGLTEKRGDSKELNLSTIFGTSRADSHANPHSVFISRLLSKLATS